MSNNIVVKEHEQFGKIRVVIIDDEPWFVARDIGKVLGLGKQAVSEIVKKLKDVHKGSISIGTPGGEQQVTIISEQGLYKMLMRSRKPAAEQFQDWIAEDVLPSIRKNGFYASPNTSPLQALQYTVEALVEQDRRLKAQEAELQTQKGKLKDVDGRVSHIELDKESCQKEFERIELSNENAREQSKRSLINRTIRAFSIKHGVPFNTVWNELYREVYYRIGFDIPARQRNKERKNIKISKLQIAEDLGILDDMWDILSLVVKQKEGAIEFKEVLDISSEPDDDDDGEKWNKFPNVRNVKKRNDATFH
jgi:prophage antirepressor-like protein